MTQVTTVPGLVLIPFLIYSCSRGGTRGGQPACVVMEFEGLSYDLELLGSFEELGPIWMDLESRADCHFFLTWDWIGTWLANTPNLFPLVLSIRCHGQVVGLALFQKAQLSRRLFRADALLLHQAGDPAKDRITVEYNDILCDRRYAELIHRSVFKFLAQAGKGHIRWNEIQVGLALSTVAENVEDAGLLRTELIHERSWFIDLEHVRSSGQPFLETLGRNTRYQIRRAINLYERNGPIKEVVAQTQKEAFQYLEELKFYHQRTWSKRGKTGSFADCYFETFHRSLIEKCLGRGAVELVRVSAGDAIIGVLYNFIHQGRVYAYQTGLCYEEDPKLKPGLVGHYTSIERHLRNGALIYDFMAGNSRYKANLGIPGPDLVHYVIQRPSISARAERLIRSWKS